MSDPDRVFWAAVEALRAREPRYAREAYAFVMNALAHVARGLPPERRADAQRRHLSGGELLAGVIDLARTEYGVMAPTVFREWGLITGDDVGRIVFELVEAGQLSARPEDRPEDFAGVPDLLERVRSGFEFGSPRV